MNLCHPPLSIRSLLTICLLGCLFSFSWAAAAAEPTFHGDVLAIFQEHCQACHRPGGESVMGMVAPMSLLDYSEVRPWAKSIARRVKDKTMPPWHAAPQHDGVFANQRTLSPEEIDTVVRWVESGAPAGDPSSAPPAREFPRGEWAIGEPDLVVRFEAPVLVEDEVSDIYKTVTVTVAKEQLPEDRYIQAMEFKPGSDVVHHIVIFTNSQRESLGFGQGMLGGMGPGTDPTVFPEGWGRKLEAGTSIIFNMHYNKEPGPGTATWDQSSIAFQFHDQPPENEVHWGAVGTMDFTIPPYAQSHEVVAEETFERDALVFALFPHTHLRGKASRLTALYPDGTQEVLLDVPNYDFNWQTNYVYREPKRLPAGTKVRVQMWYTNSKERAELAGIDPSRSVGWGQPTTDEMMYGFIDYAWLEPEDDSRSPSTGSGD